MGGIEAKKSMQVLSNAYIGLLCSKKARYTWLAENCLSWGGVEGRGSRRTVQEKNLKRRKNSETDRKACPFKKVGPFYTSVARIERKVEKLKSPKKAET